MAPAPRPARPRGRPKAGAVDATTRERLLAAAVAACVEHGFEATKLRDIGRRADVSAPAVFKHIGSKAELVVAAGRWALDRIRPDERGRTSAADVVRAFLSDDFADSRRMQVELHLAGQRHPEVAELLAKWHGDHAAQWAPRASGPDADAAVKTFFALLLGLCQVESLSALPGSASAVADQAVALADRLIVQVEARS